MPVNIVDDDILETTEYIQINISSEDSCVDFKKQSIAFAILDNDCKFSFIVIHELVYLCCNLDKSQLDCVILRFE